MLDLKITFLSILTDITGVEESILSIADESSIRKVRGFEIRTIFPGHGKPFMMNDVSNMNNHQDK